MVDTSRVKSRLLALNACNACRQRKTKCDEAKPQCSRCSRLELTCTYTETMASRKDLSVSELNGTLQRLEDKLDNLIEANATRPRFPVMFDAEYAPADSPMAVASVAGSRQDRSSLMISTERHSTAPQHLLSWACSPLHLSHADRQYPVALEIKQSPLPETVDPPGCLSASGSAWLAKLSLTQFRFLAQSYFSHFHPSYMILDELHFYQHSMNHVLQNDFDQGIDSCLVLLVLSLGSVAAYHMGETEWTPANSETPVADVGLGFFHLASSMFQKVGGVDWQSVQCLLLMASFHSCKLRVFDSWNATNKACTTILILLPLENSLNSQHCQLFWIAYLQESQVLAEFDFPASRLSDCAGDVPLPVVPDAGTGPQYRDYQFSLLAVIALRRLLNRIHSHLYSSDKTGRHEVSSPAETTDGMSNADQVLAPPQSVITELDRQLEEWRACLPLALQFPPYVLSQTPAPPPPGSHYGANDRLRDNLRARYFAAKSILHRPFLYRTLHTPDLSRASQRDMTGAQIAIDSAFQSFLYNRVMHESLFMLVHPINTWRSLVALEVQIKFILRGSEVFHYALPENWGIISEVREQIANVAGIMSPCVARDSEFLQML